MNNVLKIFGNDSNLQLMHTMKQNQHIPHACVFYGDKGTGRKMLAKYFAMTALCKSPNAPCGICQNCQKILRNMHPDVISVEHSGKKQGFSVETIRHICQEAIVAPNDDDKKIYLFTDCDTIGIPAQNTLLKLTEEPPEHVMIVFTAARKDVFLETMLSRMMQIAVRPCSPEECRTALLTYHNCSVSDADRAVQVCHGNIGMALQWLEDAGMQAMTRQAADLIHAVSVGNVYAILYILSCYEKNRQKAEDFLKLLDLQVRDAIVMQSKGSTCIGCDAASAQALSCVLTIERASQLHEAIQKAFFAMEANVSMKLVLSALGGNLILL